MEITALNTSTAEEAGKRDRNRTALILISFSFLNTVHI